MKVKKMYKIIIVKKRQTLFGWFCKEKNFKDDNYDKNRKRNKKLQSLLFFPFSIFNFFRVRFYIFFDFF